MESTTESVSATLVSFPKLGDCAYREADVIEFPWGLPGFPTLHRWLFLTLDSQPSFVWLQSLDDVNVALPTANPWFLFEDYDPQIDPSAFAALEIARASEFAYLCTVVAGPGGREMSMNLAAPVLVNLRTRKALQVTVASGTYSMHEPIPRKSDAAAAALSAKAS